MDNKVTLASDGPLEPPLCSFFSLWSKRVAWAGPAFDLGLSVLQTLASQPGKGWRLQTHAGTILSSLLGVLFSPAVRKSAACQSSALIQQAA